MKESAIEKAFVTFIENHLPCVMTVKLEQLGWPDRLVLLPGGRTLFIEFKKPGTGRLSDYQRYIIKKITSTGSQVFVVDNAKEACHIVEHAVRKART